MTESVKFYGFGSFFYGTTSAPKDVDILIVHERIAPTSIDFAIECKAMIMDFLSNAHITILSEVEERALNFVQTCNAIELARVTDSDGCAQLASLARRLQMLTP